MSLHNRTLEIDSPTVIWYCNTQEMAVNASSSEWLGSPYNITEEQKQSSNNTSNTSQTFRAAINALNNYAVPVICILGIVGDVTSFLVFVFSSFRYQPCSQYLAALAFVDTLFLILQLINSMIYFFPIHALAPGYCRVIVFVTYVCSFLSAWFVVLMMVERYIVVCHPLKALTIVSKRKALVLITIVAVFSLVIYSHSFLTTSQSKNGDSCVILQEFYGFLKIFTYFDTIIVFIIPFLALVWLNLRIILTVRKFRLKHSLLNPSNQTLQRYHNSDKTLSLAQIRSTKMLMWVSAVFIVLYLPSYATRLFGLILDHVQQGDISEGSRFRLFAAQQISHLLYNVNFAIDFIVYVMASNNFRRDVTPCLRHIRLCHRKSRSQSPGSRSIRT